MDVREVSSEGRGGVVFGGGLDGLEEEGRERGEGQKRETKS